MCKPLDFEDSQHKILMNRIISGDIILFLGSGFSLGAVSCLEGEDNRKVPFPSVDELKKLLSKTVLYTLSVYSRCSALPLSNIKIPGSAPNVI